MPLIKSFDTGQLRLAREAFHSLQEMLPIRLTGEEDGSRHYLSLVLPDYKNRDGDSVYFDGVIALYKKLFTLLAQEGVTATAEVASYARDDYDMNPVKKIPIALVADSRNNLDENKIEKAFAVVAQKLTARLRGTAKSRNALLDFIHAEPNPRFFRDEPLLGKHLIAFSLEKASNEPLARLSKWGETQKYLLNEIKNTGAIDVESQDGCYVVTIRDGKKLEDAIAAFNRAHPPQSTPARR